jgi:anti-anti-sigma factor
MASISTQLLSDGTLVVTPRGPIVESGESDEGLTGAFDGAIDHGQLRILLDLSEVEFVDSAAVAALVRSWIHLRRAGGDVVLARPAQSVRSTLKMTRLMPLFKTSETLDAGLEQLRTGTTAALSR